MQGLIVNELLPYLFSNYPAIDSSRIAITGHSAGGWGALSLGVRFPEVFKAIVAMSPVWSLAKIAYDLVDNPAASWLRVVDYSALPPSTTQSPENGYFRYDPLR
ncbi:hypothetical protein Pelo_14591 [Pelomyxa schiedti]|nr:hypothetical protein Pelo_14591 [Pelomyxa schiedti]